MKVFVKECLYVLDYKNNILDCIFNSDNHDSAGYAYEINVKDANTGYSDLTFKMPREIINADGEKVINPRLANLKPLTKVRYTRQVRYVGDEDYRVVDLDGVEHIYKHNDYLEDFLTNKTKYVMDYIIQPLDKSRSSMKIDLSFTAIDFPRFNLSKKKVGLTFDNTTLTTKELSLYKDKPLSSPGSIQYLPWTLTEMSAFQVANSVGTVAQLGENIKPTKGDIWQVTNEAQSANNGYYQYDGSQWNKLSGTDAMLSWSPNAQSGSYPLTEAAIKKLVEQTTFSYGILATVYYWPVTASGRFQGVMYEEGDYITLSLYNTYEGSDYEGSEYLDSITWKWSHLDKVQPYLSPNTATHYLRYILQNTNWKVKGDKELFRAYSATQPYYEDDETPTNPTTGEYYVKGILTENAEEEYEFATELYRYEDNAWVNKTDDTFAQEVNMAFTLDASTGVVTTDSDFGMLYDVDIEQVEVARSAQASVGNNVLTDARYSLSVSNSNCYNAITEEAKLFDLYPIFDCEEHTVSLKINAGAQYGLKYRYGYNLKSSNVKEDGEKVITKLYATGGTDSQGSSNISIGEATRSISGVSPEISSSSATGYDYTDLKAGMVQLQENAYNNMVGIALAKDQNIKDVGFKLSFPDNLYEKLYTKEQLEGSATISYKDPLIGLSNSEYDIHVLYNHNTDHCLYIYEGSDCTDETKQLYKYDYSNRSLRRNKTEYKISYSGTSSITISSINNGIAIIEGGAITSLYMKYPSPLDSNITLENKTYKASTLRFVSGCQYDITGTFTSDFVLAGPNRVYVIDTGSKSSSTYSLGNYYYFEEDDKYAYCFAKVTETGSTYDKINRISITGYVFITVGAPNNILSIRVNGSSANVILANGNPLKLEGWLSNNYALRVEYKNNNLVEYTPTEFNPNADEYLIGRSPYGTSYIYNFKYLYDNGWMSKADILDIYGVNKILNNINLEFYDKYTKALVNLQAQYNDALNNEELYASKADAQLEALMSQYWINPNVASKGEFSAFPGVPKFSDGGSLSDHYNETNHMYWEKITYDGSEVKTVYFNIFGQEGTQHLYPNAEDNSKTADDPHDEGQYHTTAKALGWESHVDGVLTLDAEIGGYTTSEDPSQQAQNYNEFIKKMKEYYYLAKKALADIDEASEALEDLSKETQEWQDTIDGYEKYIQENYGQYIIEGSYSNTEQPYSNLLFDEIARKSSTDSDISVSEKFATPNVTYTVNVIDSSGLFEYRNPGQEQCNDIIKKLHSLGQIVPRAGDYVSIYDTPMGMYGVPGLITAITRRLDDPMQNSITIDTSYTDADELVGNIITATNTVLNNKDVYGRAAIINSKGELSSTTVSNALSSGTDSINIVSTNGKVNVNDNGLTCTSPEDNASVMRYNGIGILASSNGGVTWRELMTPNGINANYINAGSINAGRVSITDGQYDITCLTSDGLAVKTSGGTPYKIGTFNTSTGAANADWSNLTVFVGKDSDGNGVGYFNGYINASKGGNIGGWSIMPGGLAYGGTLPSAPSYYLGTTGTNATINGVTANYVLKVGSSFGVDSSGNLIASGTGTSKIGPWTITSTAYYNGKTSLTDSNDGVYLGTDGIALGADNKFKVTSAGALNSTSGIIGSWTITKDYLGSRDGDDTKSAGEASYFLAQSPKYAYWEGDTIKHQWYLYIKHKFGIQSDGTLYARGAQIVGNGSFTGSIYTSAGTIGGLNISSSGLSNDNASINANGSANFHYQGGGGGDYVFNNGMTLHSTAAQTIKSGASLNLGNGETPAINIQTTASGYIHLISGGGIRINGPLSVSDTTSGERQNGKTTTVTIPSSGSITGKTLTFTNGILTNVA